MSELLREVPMLAFVGVAVGIIIIFSIFMAITTSRRWHEKNHRDGRRVMCDRCMFPGR